MKVVTSNCVLFIERTLKHIHEAIIPNNKYIFD